jgi:hypothetical protein
MDIKKNKKFVNDLFERTFPIFSRQKGAERSELDFDEFIMSEGDGDIIDGFRDNKHISEEY